MSRHASGVRHGQPVWPRELAHGRTTAAYPRFRGRRTCDVVIVGGGITGALVALTFAADGVPVILLEGGCAGCGSMLASSALLFQEPDPGLAHLTSRYGRAASPRICELGRNAVRLAAHLLFQHWRCAASPNHQLCRVGRLG